MVSEDRGGGLKSVQNLGSDKNAEICNNTIESSFVQLNLCSSSLSLCMELTPGYCQIYIRYINIYIYIYILVYLETR